ncbi:hypothetical protein CsatA_001971 [Cannabis sativa]
MICWALWRACNGLICQGKSSVANEVVSSTIAYLNQWKDTQKDDPNVGETTSSSVLSSEYWILPVKIMIKINVDASVVSGIGSFEIGWVAPDSRGNVIEVDSKLLPGCVQLTMAEAVGVKKVLS